MTPDEARVLAVEARSAVRSERRAEGVRRNNQRREAWLYENIPFYRHVVDFAGNGEGAQGNEVRFT